MRIRTEPWRAALMGALGIYPYACSGGTAPEAEQSEGSELSPTMPGADGEVTGPGSVQQAPSAPAPTVSGFGGQAPLPTQSSAQHVVSACGESTPIVGRLNLELCENGITHRVAAIACENHLDEREGLVFADGDPTVSTCSSDADCTAQPYGRCAPRGQSAVAFYECEYGCTVDSECSPGQICVCQDGVIGQCTASNCGTDEDCGGAFLCSERSDVHGCGNLPTYACQTADDTCAVDSECGTAEYCAVLDGRWTCARIGVVCGRPFLVEERERLAPLVQGSGWCERSATPILGMLAQPEREYLGAHWAQIGLMEHASIAAFARFTLQLLGLGAPLEFISASQTAMNDETAHARMAFELASCYLGRSVGPGALNVERACAETNLEQIVRLVFLEGCVGETIAALEAAEALAHCADGCVSGMLTRIAQDETNHAQLAWRFVAWALQTEPGCVGVVQQLLEDIERADVRAAGSKETSAGVTPGGVETDFDVLAHGVVPAKLRAEVRQAALGEIVLPCARALLAARSSTEPCRGQRRASVL